MQLDIDAEEANEEEYESQDIGRSLKLDEDGIEVPHPADATPDKEIRGRKAEKENKDNGNGRSAKPDSTTNPNNESQISVKATSKKNNSSNQRNKSIQPQRLRKIADGLVEFERYADRKKRLQSITDKQEREAMVKNMNM